MPRKPADPHGFDPARHDRPQGHQEDGPFSSSTGSPAAAEAIAQSGWKPDTEAERAATATIIGTGVGGSPVMNDTALLIKERGPRRVGPFTVPSFLANLAAGWISIRYGFKGPIGTPVTACAASSQAIGDGMRLILTGEAGRRHCRRRGGLGRSALDRRVRRGAGAFHRLQRRSCPLLRGRSMPGGTASSSPRARRCWSSSG